MEDAGEGGGSEPREERRERVLGLRSIPGVVEIRRKFSEHDLAWLGNGLLSADSLRCLRVTHDHPEAAHSGRPANVCCAFGAHPQPPVLVVDLTRSFRGAGSHCKRGADGR